MSISYNIDGRPVVRISRRLYALMLFNLICAMIVLTSWTAIALYVVEPLEWATWMAVSRGYEIGDVFRYPFAVLWLWPLAGAGGAWFAMKSEKKALAYTCALLPLTILAMIIAWYYLTPINWH